ncbi:hypothetical protein JB92DRAFT_2839264 [Gautieria morchelliformis]|nr:hypothetical protein JB92DRAFT_2839264 [Gautieria morchelliformis]
MANTSKGGGPMGGWTHRWCSHQREDAESWEAQGERGKAHAHYTSHPLIPSTLPITPRLSQNYVYATLPELQQPRQLSYIRSKLGSGPAQGCVLIYSFMPCIPANRMPGTSFTFPVDVPIMCGSNTGQEIIYSMVLLGLTAAPNTDRGESRCLRQTVPWFAPAVTPGYCPDQHNFIQAGSTRAFDLEGYFDMRRQAPSQIRRIHLRS